MPPGCPECRQAIFLVSLPPVSTTFAALMMMRLSPTSMCGAKIGLCLPRRMTAASDRDAPEHLLAGVDDVPAAFDVLRLGRVGLHRERCRPAGADGPCYLRKRASVKAAGSCAVRADR